MSQSDQSTSPTLFRGYTRDGLDAQYNNRTKVPAFEQYVESWVGMTASAHQQWAVETNVAYGSAAVDLLDIYRPTTAQPDTSSRRPCHVFFHGGYWFSLSKDNFGFVANGLCPHDWCTVVVDYSLIPATTMAGLIDQCQRALAWLLIHADELNIDPSQIQISGHSAGGHIVGMMMATDWPSVDSRLTASPIQSACSLSGLFDLEPIALSYLNDILGLTDDEVGTFSPVRHRCRTQAPLSLLVGDKEGPEYERQSQDLANAWGATLPTPHYELMRQHEHFSIVTAMNDPASDIIDVCKRLR